ncbi:tyrosine-type recombinase/integrase [Candidatus Woesearchaeota archaeon]|nr:tyrosine-type recombinase/integrase [Candidatus Woesearchaeota archaeon]
MQTDIIYSMKREMLRRRYSIRTIQSYIWCVNKFFKQCHKDPQRVSKKDVKEYLEDMALRNKAGSTINIHLSAIRFMLEETLRKDINLKFRYSKRPKSLPTVLTKDETRRLFQAVKNKKHKLMVELMYSAGLRLSELLNLRVRDFDEKNGWVRKGKGNKDRPFIVADKLKKRIEDYIEEEKLRDSDYLFIGWDGRMHPRTIQEIIKKQQRKQKSKRMFILIL